jgi:hypothetical protein
MTPAPISIPGRNDDERGANRIFTVQLEMEAMFPARGARKKTFGPVGRSRIVGVVVLDCRDGGDRNDCP